MLANLMRSELSRLRFRRRAWGSLILMLLIGVFTPMSWVDLIPEPSPSDQALARAELIRMRLTGECPTCVLSDVSANISFARAVETIFPQAALIFAFLAFMIVVTYVGADFTSGALATQLTFTPRRRVLLAARSLACGVLGAALMLAGMVAAVTSTVVAYLAANGTASIGAASGLLELVGASLLYGFLLGVIAALVTFIVGNTPLSMTAAVAVLFASLMLEDTSTTRLEPFVYHLLPMRTGLAVLTGGSSFLDAFVGSGAEPIVVTRPEAIAFHLGVIALLAVVAAVVFERRDIKG